MTEPTYTAELVTATPPTEAASVADLAFGAAEPDALDPGTVYSLVVPHGAQRVTVDTQEFLPAPRRTRGTVVLVDAESFATYYAKHKTEGAATMYADVPHQSITAILNDAAGATEPGWRDHVLRLALTKTPAWQRWIARDGQLLNQVQFAEHIEDSLPDIVEPDGASMLEMAQSFQAHTKVNFESGKRLQSGQTQFVYHEETTASAGTKGSIEVPQTFLLALAPFEVGEAYKVTARLRYRVSAGGLQIGYKLDRPEDVLRSAFADVVKDVQDRTGENVLYGTPPST